MYGSSTVQVQSMYSSNKVLVQFNLFAVNTTNKHPMYNIKYQKIFWVIERTLACAYTVVTVVNRYTTEYTKVLNNDQNYI